MKEGTVNTETETGVTLPRATEWLEPPQPGRGREEFSPLQSAEGTWPCQHLVGLLASRTVRVYISVVLFQAPKFVVICYTEALQNQYNIHC